MIRRISELGEIKMCKRILKHQTSTTGDVPFYKIGTFGSIPDAYISRELFNSYKSKYPFPRKGQVLLSAAGTIGRSIVFDGNDAYFQDSNIVWIDADENVVNNSYLHFYFKYLVDWNQYKSEGSVISRLYNDDLKAISILLPPLNTQIELAKEIENIESLITQLESSMANCTMRKVQIVDKYLNSIK